ncbi:MAG: hypothetical protein ACO3KD_07630, partial [Gaiellales bacterium]
MSAPASKATGRRIGVVAILVIAWLFMLIGVLGVYMHRTLYDEQVFAKRVAAVLEQPGVQNAVATELTDAIVEEVPKAVIARPLIQSAAQTVIAEPVFTEIVTTALVRFHRILLDPRAAKIVFTIEGAPQLIETTLAPYDQQLATAVGSAASAELAKLPNPGPAFRLIQLGADLGPVAWIVLVLGLGLAVLAALIAPDRRRGSIGALVTLIAVGLGIALTLGLVRIGLDAATAQDPVLNEAATGVFQGLFGDLRDIARVIAIVGALAAVLVWSLRWTGALATGAAGQVRDAAGEVASAAGSRRIEVADVTAVLKAGANRALSPAASTGGRILQGLVALGLALLVLFQWSLVVDVVVLAIAVALLAFALNRILYVVLERRGG